MTLQQIIQQISTLAVAAAAFVFWMWLACKVMKTIPAITSKLGLGETPGLIVAVIALWPLFALTYQLFRFFLHS
ncbi:hypothetical protein P378_15105 [Desulforamulus profundi]|uniref:Uncharacterized protein n=1 Tax=Desulforamulus profundi TaxID=1383067 RepID=A0A2C6M926_9FIRM|nr:hypothetical protein P378_15105 [Desulforamulus profundi]